MTGDRERVVLGVWTVPANPKVPLDLVGEFSLSVTEAAGLGISLLALAPSGEDFSGVRAVDARIGLRYPVGLRCPSDFSLAGR